MFLLPFFEEVSTRLVWIIVCAFFAGLANGCGGTMGPSVQGDVIDYDEYMTDQRKEGAYLAIWNLVRKSAASVTALITGIVLQMTGFEPNVEQSQSSLLAIRAMESIIPGGCFFAALLIFLRFRLTREAHAQVRAQLDARAVSTA